MAVTLARLRTQSFIAGSIAIAALLVVGSSVVVAATRSVAIAEFAFAPSSITINVGDRVRWTNSDAVGHTATATNGSFDTGNIDQGQTASVTFTQPGTYQYICTPHPTMTGTIRVRAAGAGVTDPPTDTVVPITPVDPGAGAVPAILFAAAGLLLGLAIARRRLST